VLIWAAVALVVALVAPPPPTAAAASAAAQGDAGERVVSFDSAAEIEANGTLHVTETITYQFDAPHHGIVRSIITRQRYDDGHDRLYPLRVISVASPDGAPTAYVVEAAGSAQDIRIGDPTREVDGRHTYVLVYELRGLLNQQRDHVELYWNATGFETGVPTDTVHVAISGPAPIGATACYAGTSGSRNSCTRNEVVGGRAEYGAGPLGPNQGLTAVAALPSGSVTPPPAPILVSDRSLSWGFQGSPVRWAVSAAALVVAALGIGALAVRRGRDRQAAGNAVDIAFADDSAQEVPRPLRDRRTVPVQFEPPGGLTPGLFGTLIDEKADVRDVSATIVDLAVRGYLRIEEIATSGHATARAADYRLVALREPDARLLDYESILLRHLFATGSSVELSDLRTTFHEQISEVRDSMYDEVVKQGWYRVRPDRTRRMWVGIGALALAASAALTALLAATIRWGLLGLGLVAASVGLVVAAHWMPARTAKGSGYVVRALGFRRFIDESEGYRAQFAERAGLFTEYLPYAIAAGRTQKWSKAFAGLAVPAPTWYVGSTPFFDPLLFGATMAAFSSTAASTLVSTPGGSGASGFSGGFAGGGGGGGGVGSW